MIKMPFALLFACLFSVSALADSPAIPSTPALKGPEILRLLDGKTFTFTASDAPLTGHTTWNAAAQTVSGDYVYNGTPGTFSQKWFIQGDKSCAQESGKDPVCNTIYAYKNGGFLEVKADGTIHGVSLPK
jgi:hypothetical protein